nr:MAG TPA: hypothetical protein [Caudoviricetes sp.]
MMRRAEKTCKTCKTCICAVYVCRGGTYRAQARMRKGMRPYPPLWK